MRDELKQLWFPQPGTEATMPQRQIKGSNPMVNASPIPHYFPYTPPPVVKMEPMDDTRNDSGVASGSDCPSVSPNSYRSDNMPYNTPPHEVFNAAGISAAARRNEYPSVSPNSYRNENIPYSTPPHEVFNVPTMSVVPSTVAPSNYASGNRPYNTTPNHMPGSNGSPCESPNSYKSESVAYGTPPPVLTTPTKAYREPYKKSPVATSKRKQPKQPDSTDNQKVDSLDASYNHPQVNSHGKIKVHKCKHCNYTAVTKMEYWNHHADFHIDPRKKLTCTYCPFVTQFKHHIEFHLMGHTGIKPFKCHKCDYSCINKSMLKSHLKSHSKVYPYSCVDCRYATKYLHSLKIHLRKYHHDPDVVRNPDGSPNPSIVIDVYGSRRGPRSKKMKNATEAAVPVSPKTQQRAAETALVPVLGAIPGVHGSHQVSTSPRASVSPQSSASPRASVSPPSLTPPQAAISPPSGPVGHPAFMFPRDQPFLPLPVGELSYGMLMNQLQMLPFNMQLANHFQFLNQQLRAMMLMNNQTKSADGALDLSKPPSEAESDEDLTMTTAFENVEVVHNNPPEKAVSNSNRMSPANSTQNQNQVNFASYTYNCRYCGVGFVNEEMYKIHMGYHGSDNPYKCNLCGIDCKNCIEFSVHIVRYAH